MPGTQSTTTFKADISQLRAEMQAASRLVRVANSEFKAATSGMDSWSSSADGLQKKIKQLNTVLSAQKKQVALAKQELERTKQEYGENSAETDRARIKLNNYEAAVGKTEKELRNYERDLDEVGKETKETSRETQQASQGFTVMKGVLANLIAAGIRAAINGFRDLGNAAKEAYEEFDKGADNAIKATGKTGAEAEKLRESFKNVSQSVIGDLDSLGSALGEVNTRFGLTGTELENATVDFQKFAAVTGVDATEAVRLVSRAMSDAGIDTKDYAEVLDLLTKASQESGIEVSKLTENLTKYGAPMRALGFDTKSSIAIFAQWEKAGVNTEIAFSGMKKAISNWSKEGKDAREEFAKTLKEIESTPDRAAATQKAIEIFGAKAGPDLADAILEGRFAYQDFLDLLEDSTGTLENTYNETQSGADKIKLAIQSMKVELGDFISDLLDQYQPQIEEFITKATEKVKEFITYIINNKEQVIGVLTAIGTTLATIFVVDKISQFVTALSSVSTAITGLATKLGILTVAETGAETATLALNTALLANPATWVVVGLGALAAAFIKLRSEQEKAIEKEYGLSKAQKESIDTVKQAADEYKRTTDAKTESIQKSESEFGYIQHLKDEYNSLIGSNGKVKKGYEDRANFIINQLAQALGVERSEIEKSIGKNGELGASIDKLIEKKKAEAILSASESAYREAIQKQQEAYTNLINAQNAATEAENRYKQSIQESGNVLETYESMLKTNASGAEEYYWKNQKVIEGQKTLRDNVEQTSNSLKQAEATYTGYNTTIKNYENLSAAIISGNSKKIGDAVLKLKNNFITAETGTKQSLENQTNNLKNSLSQMQQAVDQGSPYVTQEMVNEMKKLVNQSEKELKKLEPAAKKSGSKAGKANADGVKSQKGNVKKAARSVEKEGAKALEKGKADGKKAGKKTGEAHASGVKSTQNTNKKAAGTVTKATNKKLKEGKKDASKAGKEGGQGYADGIRSKKDTAGSAAGDVSGRAKSKLSEGQYSSGKKSGEELGKGYVDGIKSMISAAAAAAKKLADAAKKKIPKTQKSGSPSKITYKYGQDFTKGYINGIASLQGSLQTTVKGLVTNVVDQMAKMSSWNFSEVASAASSVFSDAMAKKVSYTTERISYQNELMLAKFDTNIADLEKKKTAASDKLTKASEKKQKELQTKIDKAKKNSTKKKLKKQLAEEKANLKKQITASNDKYAKLISNENKAKNAYEKASSQMLTEFNEALSNYQNKAQELIDSTINGITERYQADYDALIGKQDELINKLKSAGSLFEVSGAGVMTVNDIKEQTKAINNYADQLSKIKSKVSAELFEEIASFDMTEGSAFMSRLLSMSASDLNAYNKAYTEKMKAAEKAGSTIYSADLQKLRKSYESEIEKAFKGLPAQLEKLGTQAMKGFINGLTTNTNYMGKNVGNFVKAMVDTFKKQLGIKSPSKVMYGIGEFTVEGFNNALRDGISDVKSAMSQIASEVSMPLSGADINAGLVRSLAGQTGSGASSVSNVTNNYNLVQNNSSPKPLSALETYQARRRQISMVKALTQAV